MSAVVAAVLHDLPWSGMITRGVLHYRQTIMIIVLLVVFLMAVVAKVGWQLECSLGQEPFVCATWQGALWLLDPTYGGFPEADANIDPPNTMVFIIDPQNVPLILGKLHVLPSVSAQDPHSLPCGLGVVQVLWGHLGFFTGVTLVSAFVLNGMS